MQGFQKLSVKVGIGSGYCSLLHVGGIFGRTQYLMVGEALRQALGSEGAIQKGGEIVVSQKMWKYLEQYFEGAPSKHSPGYFKISKIKGEVLPSRNDSFLFLSNLDDEDLKRLMQQKITSYVPAAIRPYLEIDSEHLGAETRRLSIMFASLSIQLGAAETEMGLQRIQRIVTTIQNAVYRFQGSLNKLVLDDKGSILLCVWGISPYAHQDDAVRAIQCAQFMRKQLAKRARPDDPDCLCNIGISTGVVFAGVLGSAGSRKEFSVFGDHVNLSARIMGHAKSKSSEESMILVDLATKQAAEKVVTMKFAEYKQFKGKRLRLPIYSLVYLSCNDELKFAVQKLDFLGLGNYNGVTEILKTHASPFVLKNPPSFNMKGRLVELEELKDQVMHFLSDPEGVSVIGVMGDLGSGKTLLAIKLTQILNYQVKMGHWPLLHREGGALHIYASSLNPGNELSSFNAFRPILQAMLVNMANLRKTKKAKVLLGLAAYTPLLQDNLEFIEDLFNIDIGAVQKQGEERHFRVPKVGRQTVPETVKHHVIGFIVSFFKDYLAAQNGEEGSEGPPVLLILDDVHRMDGLSWEVLLLLQEELNRIAVILLWRTDFNGDPLVVPDCAQAIHEREMLQFNAQIDLGPLTRQELTALFLDDSLSTYYSQMREEIAQRTLEDQQARMLKRNKKSSSSREDYSAAQQLIEQYLVHEPIRQIDGAIIDILEDKCDGNPLLSMEFVYNLIVNHFVELGGNEEESRRRLVPNMHFIQALRIQDWTSLPVPQTIAAFNNAKIDEIGRVSDFKVKTLIVLKNASVVGDVFSTEQLQHMIPKYEQGLHDALFKILQEVESKLELIEAVDQISPQNLTYRFSRPFFRETMYQRLLFTNQKKFMHKQNASFIQQNPNADYDSEADCLRLTKHFLIAEDVPSQEMLSSTAKQIILIKRITYLLQSKAPIIKKGTLTKQGERANQKIEYRYVELTPKQLKYWHDEQESRFAPALGQIPLKHISNIMPANRMKQTSDFFITAGHWKKKNEEREMREFVFGSENDSERDAWITAISYLRTQAIQNDFNRKFHFTPPPAVRKEAPRQDATATISFRQTPVKRFSKILGGGGGGGPGDKRFSFLKSVPDQKEEIDLAQQCIKQLFTFSFAHILGHMSEKTVTGRTQDLPFSQPVQSANNLLFQQSVENLAAKIPKEPSISSSPLSSRPSDVKKFQRLPSMIKEERYQPRKTITEDDSPFKRMSGMHFRRSFTLMSATSKKTSVHDRGNPASLEEESKSEEEDESDDSFKTEFEESEEKESETESEESKEEEDKDQQCPIPEWPEEEESEKEEKPKYIDKSEVELNLPKEYKSQSNMINTSTKTEVPTVVFIEKVQKKGHSRMTSMYSAYTRNLVTPTTPSIKDPPRSPFSILSEGISHRQTASQSIAQTPQLTPRPGSGASTPLYVMVPPGGKPQVFQFPQGLLKGAQLQSHSDPSQPFVFMLPGAQDTQKMDLSGISDIAHEGSNALTELEDIKAFGQILGDNAQAQPRIRAIAVRQTAAVQNKNFIIQDGEIFDVTGGVFPSLGKAGMVQIRHQNQVGLFSLEDFKLSPPLKKKVEDGSNEDKPKEQPQILLNDGSKLTLGQNRHTGVPIRSGANSRPRSAQKSDREVATPERQKSEKRVLPSPMKKKQEVERRPEKEFKASALTKQKKPPKKLKLTGPLSQFLMRGMSAASSPKEQGPPKKFFGSGTSTQTKNSPSSSRNQSKANFNLSGSTTPRKKEEKKKKLPKRAVTRFLRPNTPSRGHQQPAQRHTLHQELLNSSLPLESQTSLYSVDVKINKFHPIIEEDQFQSEVSEKPEKRTSKFLKLNNRKKMKKF